MKTLVPYSMSFVNAEQATVWGKKQIHLLSKFGVHAYIIQQGKSYFVAREQAPFDSELVFLTHADCWGMYDLMSLNQVNERAEAKGRKTRFKITDYKIVSELI
jgi:hypothetical protein